MPAPTTRPVGKKEIFYNNLSSDDDDDDDYDDDDFVVYDDYLIQLDTQQNQSEVRPILINQNIPNMSRWKIVISFCFQLLQPF